MLTGRKNMAEIAGDDNMFAAYQVLPHVMMMLWATLKSFRIWKAIVFVGGVLFLLSCGTRGPFACLLFFGIIYFLFYMRFKGAILRKEWHYRHGSRHDSVHEGYHLFPC